MVLWVRVQERDRQRWGVREPVHFLSEQSREKRIPSVKVDGVALRGVNCKSEAGR